MSTSAPGRCRYLGRGSHRPDYSAAVPVCRRERLELSRPLIVFDLETTGHRPGADKIVEIAVCVRVDPDGSRDRHRAPRQPRATDPCRGDRASTGSATRTSRRSRPFARSPARLLDVLQDADLAGYNVRRFDVPLLDREFRDCGLDLALASRRIVDVMTIFHTKEPRDLSAAVRFFPRSRPLGAHGAEADVAASLEVLECAARALRRPAADGRGARRAVCYPCRRAPWTVKGSSCLREEGDRLRVRPPEGGRSARSRARSADYLEWFLKQDFPEDARTLVEEALEARGDQHDRVQARRAHPRRRRAVPDRGLSGPDPFRLAARRTLVRTQAPARRLRAAPRQDVQVGGEVRGARRRPPPGSVPLRRRRVEPLHGASATTSSRSRTSGSRTSCRG